MLARVHESANGFFCKTRNSLSTKRKGWESNPQGSSLDRVQAGFRRPSDCLSWITYPLDFFPSHFHRFRLRRKGELGSLAAFGLSRICPADLAQ